MVHMDDDDIIELTEDQQQEFTNYWHERNAENWGTWPPESEWPDVGVSYTATQIQVGKRVSVHIKFSRQVQIGPIIDRWHDFR